MSDAARAKAEALHDQIGEHVADVLRRCGVLGHFEKSEKRDDIALRMLTDALDAYAAERVAASWAPRCKETGQLSVNGACASHGGDGCLMASAIVQAVSEQTAALRAALKSEHIRAITYREPFEEHQRLDADRCSVCALLAAPDRAIAEWRALNEFYAAWEAHVLGVPDVATLHRFNQALAAVERSRRP